MSNQITAVYIRSVRERLHSSLESIRKELKKADPKLAEEHTFMGITMESYPILKDLEGIEEDLSVAIDMLTERKDG